jgi:hypothetical protein
MASRFNPFHELRLFQSTAGGQVALRSDEAVPSTIYIVDQGSACIRLNHISVGRRHDLINHFVPDSHWCACGGVQRATAPGKVMVLSSITSHMVENGFGDGSGSSGDNSLYGHFPQVLRQRASALAVSVVV